MRLSSRLSKEKVMENGVLFTRIGVSGESTSSAVFRHLYHLPRLRPCAQRRARSGRLGSHGHRAPSLPLVRMAASGLAANETFHWTNNQITHKGLEQEKLQKLWPSAFGALTPVLCFLLGRQLTILLFEQHSRRMGDESFFPASVSKVNTFSNADTNESAMIASTFVQAAS